MLYLLTIMLSRVTCVYSQVSESPWNRVKLQTVTSFAGIEEFYLKLRSQKVVSSEAIPLILKENLNVKKSICNNVFNSEYFRMNNEFWIDTDSAKIPFQLQSNDSEIFQEIYVKSEAHPRGCCYSFKSTYDYVNPYQSKSVSIGSERVDENVFICLTRHSPQQKVKKYLISEEYNINANPKAIYITARFILKYDNRNKLVVHAMAEESSKTFTRDVKIVELFYLDKRMLHSPTAVAQDDPVCRLTTNERVRLCASILNFSQRNLKFFPDADNVRSPCVKRAVSFQTSRVKRLAGIEIYDEWMIPCKLTSVDENDITKVAYYVSRAYISNRFFVYAMSEGHLYVDSYQYNAGVISE